MKDNSEVILNVSKYDIVKGDSVTERLVKELRMRHMPVLAWDWDGTLAINGCTIARRLIPIISRFKREHGITPIIVTGRTGNNVDHQIMDEEIRKLATRITKIGDEVEEIRVLYNDKGGNSYRYKLWVLKALYLKGMGVLRGYFDTDKKLVSMLQEAGLPAIIVDDMDYQLLADRLGQSRRLDRYQYY